MHGIDSTNLTQFWTDMEHEEERGCCSEEKAKN